MIILERKVCFMRKTFLSYLMVIMITFGLGVMLVEAADYNYSVKVYKMDDPWIFYKNRQDISPYEEVRTNGTVNPGDIIAVGVYETNKTGISGDAFDVTLKWDDEVLDPWLLDGEDNFSLNGLYSGLNSSKYSSYYTDDLPKINRRSYTGSKGENVNLLFWTFYTVKDNVPNDTLFTFSFQKAVKTINKGRSLASVTTTPATFKVFSNNVEENLNGDINGNGRIDFGDVVLIVSYVGKSIAFSDEDKAIADMNNDGLVNVADQTALINLYR